MKTLILLSLFLLLGHGVQAQVLQVLNPKVEQGDTVVIRINPQWQGQFVCVAAFSQQHVPNANGYVFIGVAMNTEPTGTKKQPIKYAVTLVECGRGVQLGTPYQEIEVLKKDFAKTRIASGRRSNRPRKGLEAKAISSAFSIVNTSSPDLTEGLVFNYPMVYHDPLSAIGEIIMTGEVIDPFGFIYRNNSKLGHYGIDFRMPVGTPVYSTNKGRVVLVARDFSKEGNMIIINHGHGIFAVYMHLSRMDVREGDMVGWGQKVGLSGESGAGVREPHLHFNIKVNGIYVDPLIFIDTVNPYLTR